MTLLSNVKSISHWGARGICLLDFAAARGRNQVQEQSLKRTTAIDRRLLFLTPSWWGFRRAIAGIRGFYQSLRRVINLKDKRGGIRLLRELMESALNSLTDFWICVDCKQNLLTDFVCKATRVIISQYKVLFYIDSSLSKTLRNCFLFWVQVLSTEWNYS